MGQFVATILVALGTIGASVVAIAGARRAMAYRLEPAKERPEPSSAYVKKLRIAFFILVLILFGLGVGILLLLGLNLFEAAMFATLPLAVFVSYPTLMQKVIGLVAVFGLIAFMERSQGVLAFEMLTLMIAYAFANMVRLEIFGWQKQIGKPQPYLSLLRWAIALTFATIMDTSLGARDLVVVMQRIGLYDHAHLAELPTGQFWHDFQYAASYDSFGYAGPIVSMLIFGVLTVWAEHLGDKRLVLRPFILWAIGIVAGVIIAQCTRTSFPAIIPMYIGLMAGMLWANNEAWAWKPRLSVPKA